MMYSVKLKLESLRKINLGQKGGFAATDKKYFLEHTVAMLVDQDNRS